MTPSEICNRNFDFMCSICPEDDHIIGRNMSPTCNIILCNTSVVSVAKIIYFLDVQHNVLSTVKIKYSLIPSNM